MEIARNQHKHRPDDSVLNPLITEVISAYWCVYNSVRPGFNEAPYHRAMCVELEYRGIAFSREVVVRLQHRGVEIGIHRVDLVVRDSLIVECKVADRILPKHKAQIGNYLRSSGVPAALILNFGPAPEIRRLNNQ